MKNNLSDAFDLVKAAAEKHEPQITKYKHSVAIVSRKDSMLCIGRNYYDGKQVNTSDGIMSRTVHAEIDALSKVNIRRLDGAIVISFAQTRATVIKARPCINCWAVLAKLGLSKVFYTMPSPLSAPLWKEEMF